MANKVVEANKGDDVESKDVALYTPGIGGVTINGERVKIKAQVNVPTLKQESGELVTIRFELPIKQTVQYIEEPVTLADGTKQMGKRENIINVARVTERTSMQVFEYVCNAITADNMETAYPNNSYVGKWFAIRKMGVVQGKRYKDVQIVELEFED